MNISCASLKESDINHRKKPLSNKSTCKVTHIYELSNRINVI